MNKKGRLIVFEGTDCSGKTTQIKLLLEKFKKYKIDYAFFDFPNYETPTGKIVRMYLNNEFGPANSVPPKIASIFYAEDRFFQKHKIEKALNDGKIVVLDRYVESNMGHQGGKIRNAEERKKFFKWIEELEYGNFNLPRPDKVIFLYVPYEVACELKKRRKNVEGDGHEDNAEHLKNAEQSYLQLANMYGWVKIDCAPDKTINSLMTPEEILDKVWKEIEHLLNTT